MSSSNLSQELELENDNKQVIIFNQKRHDTRIKYFEQKAYHGRFIKFPVNYLTSLRTVRIRNYCTQETVVIIQQWIKNFQHCKI